MNNLVNKIPIDLGDKRLNRRYEKITETIFKQPGKSVASILGKGHQLKAFYRFLANEKVTEQKLLKHENEKTISNIKSLGKDIKDIIVAQDTSYCNCNGHEQIKIDFHPTQSHIKKGANIHPTIALIPTGVFLGIVSNETWTGEKEKKQLSRHELGLRPIEEKKSYRWIKSYEATVRLAQECPEKDFFNVCDREADFYDLWTEVSKNKETKNVYVIIRSSVDRKTATREGTLRKTLASAKVRGKVAFLYQKENKKRVVHQTIKFIEVELNSPTNRPHLDKVKVWAVEAEENKPPKGEEPIKWTILTDYPVKSLEDATKILKYYAMRWNIEIFFKVLKSGCCIERIRLHTLDRFKRCLILYMSIACRILFLVKMGRTCPDLPCDIFFSSFEWKIIYMYMHNKAPPLEPPPLGKIILGIAQLGGYLNRKNDPPPGPKVMWIGMQKMHMMAFAFKMLKEIYKPP